MLSAPTAGLCLGPYDIVPEASWNRNIPYVEIYLVWKSDAAAYVLPSWFALMQSAPVDQGRTEALCTYTNGAVGPCSMEVVSRRGAV